MIDAGKLADRLERVPFIKGGYPVHVTCSEDELRMIVTALRQARELPLASPDRPDAS